MHCKLISVAELLKRSIFFFCRKLKPEYFAEITTIVESGIIHRNKAQDIISEILKGNTLSPLEVSIYLLNCELLQDFCLF